MANISYGVNILPKTNNTYTIGNSDYKWSNIYTVQLNGTNVSNLATTAAATTSSAGLMSAADKTKLDGIASGAQVNPGNATQSAAGLMSSTDKTKLDGIATGATAVQIVDNLATNDSTKALSAAQGYALNSNLSKIDVANPKLIGSTYNMDSLDFGVYREEGTDRPSNYPNGWENATIVCMRGRTNDRIQIVFAANKTEPAYRTYLNGTWSDWDSFALSSKTTIIRAINIDETTSANANIDLSNIISTSYIPICFKGSVYGGTPVYACFGEWGSGDRKNAMKIFSYKISEGQLANTRIIGALYYMKLLN